MKNPILAQLDIEVNKHLDKCQGDTHNTPMICQNLSLEGGRKRLQEAIRTYVANGGKTIAEAILQLERGLNPNLIND